MAGFLARRFDRWAVQQQQSEIDDYLKRLRGMGEEGSVFSLQWRRINETLRPSQIDFSTPFLLVAAEPTLPIVMSQSILRMQKDGNLAEAGAWMVWLHTVRDAARLELRLSAMWAELERGFDSILSASADYQLAFGGRLNIERAAVFPIGIEPFR